MSIVRNQGTNVEYIGRERKREAFKAPTGVPFRISCHSLRIRLLTLSSPFILPRPCGSAYLLHRQQARRKHEVQKQDRCYLLVTLPGNRPGSPPIPATCPRLSRIRACRSSALLERAAAAGPGPRRLHALRPAHELCPAQRTGPAPGPLAHEPRRRPGRHVGVLLPNIPEYLAALQAIWLTGATALQLSPLMVGDEVGHWLEATDCRIVDHARSAGSRRQRLGQERAGGASDPDLAGPAHGHVARHALPHRAPAPQRLSSAARGRAPAPLRPAAGRRTSAGRRSRSTPPKTWPCSPPPAAPPPRPRRSC